MDYLDLYNFVNSSGTVVPSIDNVLTGVQDKFKEIFGTDLDVSPSTPVGRLIEGIALLVRSSLGVTAQASNQFNPNLATGINLDALAQIFGLERNPGARTRVPVTCNLTNKNAIVPKGSQILNDDNELFETEEDIVVAKEADDGSYLGYGVARAIEYGPVNGAKGSVSRIASGITGWSDVTNGDPLQVGYYIESDAAFRQRIINTRPSGAGFIDTMVSRIQRIDGIRGVCILENNGPGDVNIKGVPVLGHSIFVCVGSSGDDMHEKVALEILRTKPPGTGLTDVEPNDSLGMVKVTRELLAYDGALVPTNIVFYTPQEVPIHLEVTIDDRFYQGENLEEDIRTLCIEYINTIDIGKPIFGYMISNHILSHLSNLMISNILISLVERPQAMLQSIDMLGYQIPTLVSEQINIKRVSYGI